MQYRVSAASQIPPVLMHKLLYFGSLETVGENNDADEQMVLYPTMTE